MYSVILATVLSTAGGASEQWHRSHWCHGCGGCSGCSGGNPWGWGTFSYCSGGFGASACSGGYGCSGYSGCYGGYGCSGCYGSYANWGAYAVYGNYNYCHGGYGYAPVVVCHGGYGCYGGWSCYGPTLPAAPAAAPATTTPPAAPTKPGIKLDEPPLPKEKKKDEVRLNTNRSTVIVELPADAKLFIDDQLMQSTSARRIFNTPALQEGQTYFYDIRAEIIRDGRTVTQAQRVILNPGQQVVANFTEMANQPAATAQSSDE
jgi:uncharacterized protein (TIGR03000 family)